ncbi:MAG: DUF4430 domain-containing protein [Defluviitaleaceae bacterium]|nr:DUF4430 domain-containing protein [Defluviitaleaceae bacterium]
MKTNIVPKIVGGVVIVALLVTAWFWGGVHSTNAPAPELAESSPLETMATPVTIPDLYHSEGITEFLPLEVETLVAEAETQDDTLQDEPSQNEYEYIASLEIIEDEETFEETPEIIIPVEVEPAYVVVDDGSFYVTLSVRAHTILDNMHLLHRDKHELVPEDGWILHPRQVLAWEGESVFDILQRETRQEGIHMAARFTPAFNTAYIEAINNLYEYDVGPLSGWKYRVNGWFPNFGSSQYLLSEGDIVEWLYTVDLGRDIGAEQVE